MKQNDMFSDNTHVGVISKSLRKSFKYLKGNDLMTDSQIMKDFEEKFINNIKVYSTEGMCWNIPSTCIRGIQYINLEKKNNYIFYYRK